MDDDDDDRIYKANVVVIPIPDTAWKSERLPVRLTLCVLWINVVNVQNEIYETE